MDIEDARERKIILEEKMYKLIKQFEDDTSLKIEDIIICRGKRTYIGNVHIPSKSNVKITISM